jgi:hypothetical protein
MSQEQKSQGVWEFRKQLCIKDLENCNTKKKDGNVDRFIIKVQSDYNQS